MGFKSISLNKYISLHLQNNPKENKREVEKQLNRALMDYQNRVKCACGNNIWVIGSAFIGNGCFTCITGEDHPKDDYELESALPKAQNRHGQKNIDDLKPEEIHGLFDDDGFKINTELIKKPGLCLTCVHNNDPNQELLCNMTRFDQEGESEFVCYAFKKLP